MSASMDTTQLLLILELKYPTTLVQINVVYMEHVLDRVVVVQKTLEARFANA